MIANYEESRKYALKALGSAASAPTSKTVWEQRVNFRPHHWSNQWPKNVEKPPLLVQAAKKEGLSITRNRLFELGKNITTEVAAMDFYFAVCAWGTGSSALNVTRCIKPLRQPRASERIFAALTAIQDLKADDAYLHSIIGVSIGDHTADQPSLRS